MRQQTSNTVHRVRQQLAEVLLGDEARHMLNPGDRFREFCVRIGYRNSGNPPFYSALDCPILHSKYASDQEKKYDPSDAFMNIRLMLVSTCPRLAPTSDAFYRSSLASFAVS